MCDTLPSKRSSINYPLTFHFSLIFINTYCSFIYWSHNKVNKKSCNLNWKISEPSNFQLITIGKAMIISPWVNRHTTDDLRKCWYYFLWPFWSIFLFWCVFYAFCWWIHNSHVCCRIWDSSDMGFYLFISILLSFYEI